MTSPAAPPRSTPWRRAAASSPRPTCRTCSAGRRRKRISPLRYSTPLFCKLWRPWRAAVTRAPAPVQRRTVHVHASLKGCFSESPGADRSGCRPGASAGAAARTRRGAGASGRSAVSGIQPRRAGGHPLRRAPPCARQRQPPQRPIRLARALTGVGTGAGAAAHRRVEIARLLATAIISSASTPAPPPPKWC